VNCCNAAAVSGVETVEECTRFLAANFAKYDSICRILRACLRRSSNVNTRFLGVRVVLALHVDNVRFVNLEFARVFDNQDAFGVGNKVVIGV